MDKNEYECRLRAHQAERIALSLDHIALSLDRIACKLEEASGFLLPSVFSPPCHTAYPVTFPPTTYPPFPPACCDSTSGGDTRTPVNIQ
jgi:hypothetical protein